MSLRKALVVGGVLLPWTLRRLLYRRLLGWEIHSTARVGLSLIDAATVRLGPGSRIGHFTVFRNLAKLELHSYATVGNWNWCSSAAMFDSDSAEIDGRQPFRGLTIGAHSAITSRHYVDCSGGVTIGQFSIVGGVRSTVLSHQIDFDRSIQTTRPVSIGDYCFVSSNVSITPGSHIPSRSVVAMGSVVVGVLSEEGMLYAGIPARPIRGRIDTGNFFARRRGRVGLPTADHADGPLRGR